MLILKICNKGITIISLVITIIILLILSGITITLVLNDNGVIAQALNTSTHGSANLEEFIRSVEENSGYYIGRYEASNVENIKTGAERCNIFEMASNCYEWSTEIPSIGGRTDSNKYSCVRGTSDQYGDIVSYRGYNLSTQTNMGHVSFRPILFLN